MKKLVLTLAFLTATFTPALAGPLDVGCTGSTCATQPPVVKPQPAPAATPSIDTDKKGFQPAAAGSIPILPPVGGGPPVILPPPGGR